MPPELAAVFCVALIAYLFWRELSDPHADRISWLPLVWMFIAGSRFVSSWLNMRTPGSGDGTDGSPVDRAFFLTLIVLGSMVLARRRVDWESLFRQNKWLVGYLLYCLLSMAWADEPFVLFKRWVKDLGNPIMALILLTERRPYDAVATTIRRLSYLFLPLSLLFIKYFPELGRYYTNSGGATYTGVGDNKNALGLICLITALFYLWSVIYRRDTVDAVRRGYLLLMIGPMVWLLQIANSQTSILCLLAAATILLLSRRTTIEQRPTRLIGVAVSAAVLYMVADASVGVQEHVYAFVGRDATLTNRTTIWALVSSHQGNQWVGVGFMSFWQGERLYAITQALGARLNQAHNGYLEQYVNLGVLGLAFIGSLALTTLLQVRRQLATDYPTAILRFTVLIVTLLYNYTEASFSGVNNIWLLFLTSAIHPKAARIAVATEPSSVKTAVGQHPRNRLRTFTRARRRAVAGDRG